MLRVGLGDPLIDRAKYCENNRTKHTDESGGNQSDREEPVSEGI